MSSASPPPADLGLAVVIPCCDEPDLPGLLESLTRCRMPSCGVEAIVVINHALDAPPEVRVRNQMTWQEADAWASRRNLSPGPHFRILYHPDLPARHAGVGMARKIGMDLAMRFFLTQGRPDGVIAALDADCRVAPDYLTALVAHFQHHPKTPGCAIHFRHDLTGLPARQRLGIASYELSLRYVVQGWRYCGLPNAFHTVGSAMAVRAAAYRAQGGMNRRQAGEDFYFLQKIMALGHFTALTSPLVFPSARVSHRVPFGTGRAMARWMEQTGDLVPVWNPAVFAETRPLFAAVESLYATGAEIPGVGSRLARFLASVDFAERVEEMRRHTASPGAFRKRFFRWFDGFRFLKWAHWATTDGLEERPVGEAALLLLALNDPAAPPPPADIEALLTIYDRLDRIEP